jgi:NAD(P)-dependent dehydrogenase (short-subunit alcohol dehydrogenase family)
MSNQTFEGKKVFVVGGSSGIGEATAQAFADQGAEVTIASRSEAKLKAAAAKIGGKIQIAVLDTADVAAIDAFFASAGAFDHIVISASQTPTGAMRQLSLEDARAAMESKFWGAYRVARAARFNESASLTFVSGYLSVRPSKTSVVQGAVNAAVEALARGLALELSPVRVNTVSPGLIATPLWDKLNDDARQALYDSAAAKLPAQRVGQAEDVASAVLYLASNGFATGSTVLIDGGGAIS